MSRDTQTLLFTPAAGRHRARVGDRQSPSHREVRGRFCGLQGPEVSLQGSKVPGPLLCHWSRPAHMCRLDLHGPEPHAGYFLGRCCCAPASGGPATRGAARDPSPSFQRAWTQERSALRRCLAQGCEAPGGGLSATIHGGGVPLPRAGGRPVAATTTEPPRETPRRPGHSADLQGIRRPLGNMPPALHPRGRLPVPRQVQASCHGRVWETGALARGWEVPQSLSYPPTLHLPLLGINTSAHKHVHTRVQGSAIHHSGKQKRPECPPGVWTV